VAATFDPATATRVVIRAPNWLGDAVMALPAMAGVRRTFPRSELTIAAPAAVAPMFDEITDASPDVVLTVERRTETGALRARGFDLAILLPNSFHSAWIARRAGIPHRWGRAAHARRWLLTRAVRSAGKDRHQSARYLDLMDALGIHGADDVPRVAAGMDTRRRALELLSRHGVTPFTRVVGIAPGAAYGHAKRWPPGRMAQLIGRLGDLGTTVLLGAAGDRDTGREIESALPASTPVVNLIGRTDLRLLVGLLERCQAFVSNDSGAMHLAAALGVPVTAIFGPTDERVTAPRGIHGVDVISHPVFCRPCMLRDCPIDHRCMKRIAVDRVFDAVAHHVSSSAGGPS
jgi:heptosyltransferase-2